MKRMFMALAIVFGMIFFLAPAATATGDHDEKCYETVVDRPAYDETVTVEEAWDEKVIDTPGQPGKDAVTKTVYIFEQKKTGKTKEVDDPNWNSGPGKDKGWNLIGEKVVEVEPAVPAVEEVSHIVKHEAVTKVVHHEATTKEVEVPCVPEPPAFERYETEVCWTMDTSDGIEGTYEWPQTRSATCTPVPKCEEVIEIQRDLYWIESQEDEDYLAGLTTLNSPADDASLSPHDYYSKVFVGADCPVVEPPVEEPPVEEPPVTEPPVVVEPPAVEADEPPADVDTPDEPKADEPVVTTDVDQVLPNTGGASKFLVVVGILLIVGGAFTLLRRRRLK